MQPAKGLYKVIWAIAIASELLLGGLSATSRPNPQSGAETVGGLQITISVDQAEVQSKTPKFGVELRNLGETDLILNLGFMLANGRTQYPVAVVLTLTDAQGTSRRLDLRGPFAIAGRVDPLIVPLPAGSTFSLPVDLDKYWAVATKEFDYKPTPGTYSIQAQFTGVSVSDRDANLDVKGIALMPYWNGTVRSNLLRFEVRR